jgi:hypothetical protein
MKKSSQDKLFTQLFVCCILDPYITYGKFSFVSMLIEPPVKTAGVEK